jgi:hypothetical protein
VPAAIYFYKKAIFSDGLAGTKNISISGYLFHFIGQFKISPAGCACRKSNLLHQRNITQTGNSKSIGAFGTANALVIYNLSSCQLACTCLVAFTRLMRASML